MGNGISSPESGSEATASASGIENFVSMADRVRMTGIRLFSVLCKHGLFVSVYSEGSEHFNYKAGVGSFSCCNRRMLFKIDCNCPIYMF